LVCGAWAGAAFAVLENPRAASPRTEATRVEPAAVPTMVRMRLLIISCHSLGELVVLTHKELRPALDASLEDP